VDSVNAVSGAGPWPIAEGIMERNFEVFIRYVSLYGIFFSSPIPPHVPYRIRGLPSRLWPKCNRV
jgi:hypothetical protein